MRFCTGPFIEGLLVWLLLSLFLQFVLLFPRSHLTRVFSTLWKNRSSTRQQQKQHHHQQKLSFNQQPPESLLCYNFLPDGGDRTIVNETQPSPAEQTSDAASEPPQPCDACQYWRYFDFAAEGKTFQFSTLTKEFVGFGDKRPVMNQVVAGGVNSTKPAPTTTWGRGGGSCLKRADRPVGCYLILHVKLDYLGAALSSVLDTLLGIERPASSHETILSLNSLEDEWLLRWEVSSLRFTMGDIEAVHQICYCRHHLCNGALEPRDPDQERILVLDNEANPRLIQQR